MNVERLVAISGSRQGEEFPIEKQLEIGRSPDNDIVLADRLVSRKHAVLERTPAGVFVRDLNSGNGTFVGGHKIVKYRLSQGDLISIGSTQFEYHAGDSTPGSSFKVKSNVVLSDSNMSQSLSMRADDVMNTMLGAPARAEQDGAGNRELLEAQRRLAAVYKANQAIVSETDLNKCFDKVLDEVFGLVPANNGVIMLDNTATHELETVAERLAAGAANIRVSTTVVEQSFNNAEAILLEDAMEDDRFDTAQSIIAANIASVMCVPLQFQQEVLGVIYLDTRGSTSAFDQSDMELVTAVAAPAAISIKNAQYLEQLEHDFQTTLVLLANAIELRDHYTLGHTWRVTNYALAMARELGWSADELKRVEMGGVLHDVGKIAVEDAVLRKPGRLTNEEFEKMKVHPERGAALMRDCKKLEPLIPFCLYHHEKYDGRGYPYGLKGDEIPIEGRLIAVADTFDAMTSNRPYRDGLDPEIAVAEIEKCKGTQFDPVMADAFIAAYRKDKINHILQDYYKQDEKSMACPFCSTYIKVHEAAEVQSIHNCPVCHRHVRLEQEDNGRYYGVLLSQTEIDEYTQNQVPDHAR